MPPTVDDSHGEGEGEGEGKAQPGPLRPDHAVRCGCGCGGVSAESLRRAAAPRTRPKLTAYHPSSSLKSVLLLRGKGDRSLLDAALAEAKGARPDDQMVLEGGCNLPRVPLLEHPEYPSCRRYASALCSDGELATYGAGVYQAPANTLTLTRIPYP